MTITPDVITTNRTQMVTRQRCPHERFLGHHYQGGWQLATSSYETALGTALHIQLAHGVITDSWLPISKAFFSEWADKLGLEPTSTARNHFIEEQYWLAALLVHGWYKRRWPYIMFQYNVLSVEVETTATFQPDRYLPSVIAPYVRPLALPLRFDVLLQPVGEPDERVILDWKTASRAGEDWNNSLDNSLQSCLYIAGLQEQLPDHYISGITYEGLVKGYRKVDDANSSPYKGLTINYGSFLYGWERKSGVVSSEYQTGSQRVFLPDEGSTVEATWQKLETVWGAKLNSFFPCTQPWRPVNLHEVVGQQIMAENRYTNDVEFYESVPEPAKQLTAATLFERHLDNCFKYGTKHQCAFVKVCHGNVDVTNDSQFTQRVDHHSTE